jgi:serine/threonine protein kinase
MSHGNDDIQTTHLSRPNLPPAEALLPGQMIGGKYKVLSMLGAGGIGSVYKVEQIFLTQEFALKTLHSGSASEQMIRRFQNEARTASLLNHPNLVKVNDFGILESQEPYLIMDYVDGYTLSEYLKKNGMMNLDQIVSCFAQICLGLAYAHEQGIVHRDIKPSNIMISRTIPFGAEGFVKIVDFGIAKLVFAEDGDRQALTRTGEVFGSPLYMSPEQCSGGMVDQRADVYSLGCVLFECLTGTTPFVGQNALTTMLLHQSELAPTLREASLGKEFPKEMEELVQKMLAKAPSDRYQNLGIVANDLAQISKGAPVLGLDQTKKKTQSVSKSLTLTHEKLAFYIIAPSLCTALVALPAGYFLGKKQLEGAPGNGKETTKEAVNEPASKSSAEHTMHTVQGISNQIKENSQLLESPAISEEIDGQIAKEELRRKQQRIDDSFYQVFKEFDETPPKEKGKLRVLMVKLNQLKEKAKNDERLRETFAMAVEDKITLCFIKLGELATAESRVDEKLKRATKYKEIAEAAGFYQAFAERRCAVNDQKGALRYYQKGADNFIRAFNTPGCDEKSATSYRSSAANFLRCASIMNLHYLHNIPQAVKVGDQARLLAEGNNNDDNDLEMANILLTLGSALSRDKQYARAETVLVRSERLFQTTKEKDDIIPLALSCARLELSEVRFQLNRKAEALEAANGALNALNRFKTKESNLKQIAATHRTNIESVLKRLEAK